MEVFMRKIMELGLFLFLLLGCREIDWNDPKYEDARNRLHEHNIHAFDAYRNDPNRWKHISEGIRANKSDIERRREHLRNVADGKIIY